MSMHLTPILKFIKRMIVFGILLCTVYKSLRKQSPEEILSFNNFWGFSIPNIPKIENHKYFNL